MSDTGGGPLAALDPGRSKCGLVCTDRQRATIVHALVLPPEATLAMLRRWRREHRLAAVVLGNGTGSRHWRRQLEGLLPVEVVEERSTTLEGRRRYWELFPPRGWIRLLPTGLRQPPRDWDDVVAQVLLERWLRRPLLRKP
jgi:RNase H-fold protein (predicted Holliday junction resolvase)